MDDVTWYVIYTWAKAERDVERRLQDRLGLATYAPLGTRWVKRGRKHVLVELHFLAFPRYLFVGFETRPLWLNVRGITGIEAVLGCEGEPKPIPARVVGDIQAAQIAGQFDERCPVLEPMAFIRGAPIKVMRGPFEGTVGKFGRLSGEERARVLINMLGREVETQISLDELALVA